MGNLCLQHLRRTCSPSIWEAEAVGLLQVQGQPDLPSDFQISQGHRIGHHLKQTNKGTSTQVTSCGVYLSARHFPSTHRPLSFILMIGRKRLVKRLKVERQKFRNIPRIKGSTITALPRSFKKPPAELTQVSHPSGTEGVNDRITAEKCPLML